MNYFLSHRTEVLQALLEHLGLTLLSLLLAALIAVPAGIAISRRKAWASTVLGVAGVLQTIPSIALLGSLIPLLGIGFKPAIFTLLLYAILPILRNTYTGIQGVDPAVKEAAKGLGLTPQQVLRQVELPLAAPVILAGLRTAAVINVGVATLAAYIGAGGLGDFIFKGIALDQGDMILAGAVPAALLAILMDQGLAFLSQLPLRRAGVVLASIIGLVLGLFLYQNVRPSFTDTPPVLQAAFDPEFAERPDCMPSVRAKYPGLELDYKTVNPGLLYEAVASGEVDIISGYSTDGRIQAYELRVLADDRHAFPPYQCGIVLNEATAQRYPALVTALEKLNGRFSDSLMTALNFAVDHQKEDPAVVAQDFLRRQALLGPSAAPQRAVAPIRIGSKLFTEQYILAEIFRQLIEHETGLAVELKTGLGGTQICYAALRAGEIDLYAEYSGTGLQVLLDPPPTLLERIITDPAAVYTYVQRECLAQHQARWLPTLGFSNTYALVTREALARERAWVRISDLVE
ncbi:MAG: ABC transporter permease/substrate-binding protein [Bacteroidota bacterium]